MYGDHFGAGAVTANTRFDHHLNLALMWRPGLVVGTDSLGHPFGPAEEINPNSSRLKYLPDALAPRLVPLELHAEAPRIAMS